MKLWQSATFNAEVIQAVLGRLHLLLAALWWGGTTALAVVAVPVLFSHFDMPAVAGAAAAQLFAAQSIGTVVLAGLAMLVLMLPSIQAPSRKQLRIMWASGAALAVCNQWLVAPLIITARSTGGNLQLWHGMGSTLILVQWLLGLCVMWMLACTGVRRDAEL